MIQSILVIPKICRSIYKVMKQVNHIHLRCPGNVGILGCIVQVFFPLKSKTAKYAGNWDPKSKQPITYRLQKWILRNTFLSKNIKVLVYGNWPKKSKNILPFFTASYQQHEIKEIAKKIALRIISEGVPTYTKNEILIIKSKARIDVARSVLRKISEF